MERSRQTETISPGIARKRILVVDDEPLVCNAVKMMLEFDGHQIETANSAADALTLFDQSNFDLVVTDYSMSGMKGNELAAAIKARAPGRPVVMITAYAEMLAANNTPLDAVDAIISKPFLLADLRAAIVKATKSK